MAPGLLAFLSRQFAPTIMDLRPLHIVCTSYISIFPFWASVAGGEGRPRSEAPCSTYGYQFAPWATDGSASAASEIEVGSIYPTTQELRAAAAKQAETCVARMTWCGAWRVEGVSPYVGIRMGSIGWNDGGPLIGCETTKNS